MGREVTSEAGQDIMSLIMQFRQSATKTARRTARSCFPEGDGGEPPSCRPLSPRVAPDVRILSSVAAGVTGDAAAGVVGLETRLIDSRQVALTHQERGRRRACAARRSWLRDWPYEARQPVARHGANSSRLCA